MSRLRKLINYSILISIVMIGPWGHGLAFSNDLEVIAGKNSDGALHTDAGDLPIGFTLQQYEAVLKRLEKDVEMRFVRAHENDRPHLEIQLYTIQSHLQDIEQSYWRHIESLTKRIEQLESLRGQVPDELLSQVQRALAGGDSQQAEQLFHQMETQSANASDVTAEVNYQRCQVAKDKMRHHQAFLLCQRAAQQAPDRADYLSDVADLAHILGDDENAVVYYERALASTLKEYREDHPDVAISRNNLGTAWDALGEYEKAIGYYELALASDIKVYGEDHPDVAIDRNNLGMAWYALGEYQHAIAYFEQALASDIKTYGEDHLQIATYYNNLAGAWFALGEYQKAQDYMERALKGFEHILGQNHPNTNGVRANYQQLLLDIQK